MEQSDYIVMWSQLHEERSQLLGRRTDLETELSEINNKIAHTEEIMKHLAPMAGVSESVSGMGITDAIRWVLKNSEEKMSAQDVRQALNEHGFDLSKLSAPMASIYKVLSRLANDSQEIERELEENASGRSLFYRWKVPARISDEDIPF